MKTGHVVAGVIVAGAIALSALTAATAQPADGQSADSEREPPRLYVGVGRGQPDTDLYFASSAAATRAIAICNGLWSANQTMQDVDRYWPLDPYYRDTFVTEINKDERTVSIAYDDRMPPRILAWRPVLGCAQLPPGATPESRHALPQVASDLRVPDMDGLPWPAGDRDALGTLPAARQAALDDVVANAFDGTTYGGITWGIVVVTGGKIVAERYDLNFDMHKGAQTHSAAKSFAATMIGIGVRQYDLDIHGKGILDAWRRPSDPRYGITLDHLLRMSSGLYGEGSGGPQADIYANGATVAGRATTNFLHTLPGTRFVYNPPDTMLLMRALREAVADDATYWAMPFTELFWKIGMTRTTPSTDWNGDFLMSGQTYSTARDFARFGLLYLNEGIWLGERILPEGWSDYVATPGPVQPDGEAGYGAQFWLYGGIDGLPQDAYSPSGGNGNWAVIIPSKDLVVVRRGYDRRDRFDITRFAADVIAAIERQPDP